MLGAILLVLTCGFLDPAQEPGDSSGAPLLAGRAEAALTGVRPDAGGAPTRVSIDVRVLDLTRIDDVAQTLTGDFAVLLRWTDPRLAHLEGRHLPLDEVWTPDVVFGNAGPLSQLLPEEVRIGEGGQVLYVQRCNASFAVRYPLADFPFDRQTFRIWMRPVESTADQVVLVPDERAEEPRDRFNLPDWEVLDVSAHVASERGEVLGAEFSRFELRIEARRLPTYYLWKVILPLCLIVAMSWLVFWIPPHDVQTQVTLAATAMLTLIAFIFTTTTMLPELGYFTRLDRFTTGSMVLVFLALLQSVATGMLVSKGRSALATRIDCACRLLFPLAFVPFSLLVFLG